MTGVEMPVIIVLEPNRIRESIDMCTPQQLKVLVILLLEVVECPESLVDTSGILERMQT